MYALGGSTNGVLHLLAMAREYDCNNFIVCFFFFFLFLMKRQLKPIEYYLLCD